MTNSGPKFPLYVLKKELETFLLQRKAHTNDPRSLRYISLCLESLKAKDKNGRLQIEDGIVSPPLVGCADELAALPITPNARKLMAFLISNEKLTATQLSKAADIPRTETYYLIYQLEEKGLVVISGLHPRFVALSADPFEHIRKETADKAAALNLQLEMIENKYFPMKKTLPSTGVHIKGY